MQSIDFVWVRTYGEFLKTIETRKFDRNEDIFTLLTLSNHMSMYILLMIIRNEIPPNKDNNSVPETFDRGKTFSPVFHAFYRKLHGITYSVGK